MKLLKRLNGAGNGDSRTPPRMQILAPYGVVTLEAKWLMPAGAGPTDVAKDPKSCLIAVTIELRENAIAYAARILRESGATPTQLKIGIGLALGKTKPAIADELGIKPTSVADLTRKLYQTLDVHNAAELGAKIWLTLRHYAFFRIPNSGDATSAIAAWMRNIGGSGGGDRVFENFGVGSTARDRAQKIAAAEQQQPPLPGPRPTLPNREEVWRAQKLFGASNGRRLAHEAAFGVPNLGEELKKNITNSKKNINS